MSTPSIQTLITQAQQVLNLKSSNEIRATLAAILANANVGTPLNPNLTTQQLWDEFYEIVRQPSDDIMSIITDQMMRMVFSPPAPGGAGADKQVIFNDGGVLSGDTKFLWDKNANRLDVDGPVVITGALTVDTSTLKVDSTNHRVGIGTATPANQLSVRNEGASAIAIIDVRGGIGGAGALQISGNGTTLGTTSFNFIQNGAGAFINNQDATPLAVFVNGSERYAISSSGVATWSNVGGTSGTAMTLNSTGLGIGVSPSYAFQIKKTLSGTSTTVNPLLYLENNGAGNSAKITLTDGLSNNGYIVYSNETGTPTLGLGVGSAQQLVVNASGNVGIGVTPSAWISAVKALQISSYGSVAGSSSNFNILGNLYSSPSGTAYVGNGYGTLLQMTNGQYVFYQAGNNTLGAGASATLNPSMTLDASGNLLVGKTASSTTVVGSQIQPDGTFSAVKSDTNPAFFYNRSTAASGTIALFRSNSVTVGSITQDGTNTAYVTSSDYRLKEAVQPLVGGLARVSALKPSIYKWKSNGSSGEGFIAHELAEVVPAAVTGEKDAVNEDGTVNPQGVDLSKVVPILVAAIQELTARVQTLEAK